MHDARALINLGTEAVRKLARRGYSLDLASLEELQSRRVQSIRSAEERRAEAKRVAKEVQRTAKEGGDITGLKERARKLKEQIHEVETEQGQIQQELDEFLLDIPNLPLDETPEGDSEEFATEIRRVGTPQAFSFSPKDHVDLGEALGIF
ncbi:MAG TPA: hypothetical protein H9836_00945, partial [Candidatus Nocardiopsis merdipullorum]|nr:hypothetical protein [Candidatus Nocardiopsis merdipullorum]